MIGRLERSRASSLRSLAFHVSHVSRILHGLGMKCGKPYQNDYRQPLDASQILKNLDELYLDESWIVGFLDEIPQTTSNTVRLWSFTHPRLVKNTTKLRANALGFYALNGESHINFKTDSRAGSFCEFFKEIREKNPGKKILVILDNFSSHKAKIVRTTAKDLGITLLYLPPYSPNPNPIEFIWKTLKRRVPTTFILTKEELAELILTFNELPKSLSYAMNWIKNNKFNKLCN